MVLCLLFVISLAGCGKGNTKNLVIDYGTSSIYTKDDMDDTSSNSYFFALSFILNNWNC